MKAYEYLPQIMQLRGSILTVYNDFNAMNTSKKYNGNSLRNLEQRTAKKGLSKKAIKTMSGYINLWFNAIDAHCQTFSSYKKEYNKHMTFVTLTLSSAQIHTDKEVKRECLNGFITYARKMWHIKTYCWVAESQVNGNIHFHILFDRFVKHADIRKIWNIWQNKLGYVDRFAERHNHYEPNSTDVHSLQKVNYIDRYLVKYMSKNEERRQITGAIWGSSDNLKQLNTLKIEIDSNLKQILDKLADNMTIRQKDSDYFYLFCNVKLADIKRVSVNLYEFIVKYYCECFDFLYN